MNNDTLIARLEAATAHEQRGLLIVAYAAVHWNYGVETVS